MGSSASAALAALIALSAAGCAVDRTGLQVGDSGTPPVDLGEVDAFVENDTGDVDLGTDDLGREDLGGEDLGGGDLGAPGPIVSLDTGTFTRNLVAYQRDSDPIAGAFYSLVPIDTLRYETLADGGRLALIEGARTNDVLRSRIRSGAGWGAGSRVVSTDSQPGPDGTNNASRENVTINGYSRYSLIATAAPFTSSLWQMAPAANASYHVHSSSDTAGVRWEAASGLTSAWQRAIVRQTTGTARSFIPSDARAGALAAAAHDTVSDFVQSEAGRFPSSPIVNAGTVGQTRPADTLTWAAAPASLLSQRHGFRHVRPIFPSSSSVVDGDVFWLMSIADGSNGVRISQTAGVITIEAVESGVVKASSQPFTTLADTDLGSVEWDPAAGLVFVNATAGPAGTPWTWAVGPLRVGGIYGGASEAFCGLSDIW